jgi:cytochrome c-type biogenesis protein CcmH
MKTLPREWILAALGAAAAALFIAIAAWMVLDHRVPAAPSLSVPAPAPAMPAPGSVPGLDVMAQRLAARLESTGANDGAGWELLARAYVELRRHAEAVKAFERARKLQGDGNAQLLADFADARAVANGRHFDAAVSELIAAALKADPGNAKAIELDASAAYEIRDYGRAVAQWEKLLARTDPSSNHGRVLAANIAEARGKDGIPPSGGPSWKPEAMKGLRAAGR